MERTWEQANHEQLQALGQRLDALVRMQADACASLDQIRQALWILVVGVAGVGLLLFSVLNRL